MAKKEYTEKDFDNAAESNKIIEIPSDNVDLKIDHEEDLKCNKDISGEPLDSGDFIIIFSDNMNPNMLLDDMFKDHIEMDAVDCPCMDSAEEFSGSKSTMPMGIIPAIIQAISDGTVIASPINYYKKYASTDFYKVASYQVAKITDCASFDDALTKLYNNIHMYNVLREAFILDKMLSK